MNVQERWREEGGQGVRTALNCRSECHFKYMFKCSSSSLLNGSPDSTAIKVTNVGERAKEAIMFSAGRYNAAHRTPSLPCQCSCSWFAGGV